MRRCLLNKSPILEGVVGVAREHVLLVWLKYKFANAR